MVDIKLGLFSRKPTYCAVCNKQITHKHKPKREWNVKGPLCADCHVDKTKEFYEAKVRQPCIVCGTTKKISDFSSVSENYVIIDDPRLAFNLNTKSDFEKLQSNL